MDLSIVIVNWNSTNYLRKCLRSVYFNTKGLGFEVIVVDNASYDGCGEMLQREFLDVRFIQSSENLGFARANNLGFEESTGRKVLFLNPDTEVFGPALERLVAALDSDPAIAIVGPRVLNPDLSVQNSCIQRFPSIFNHLLSSDYLRAKFPRARIWGTRPLLENSSAVANVEVIPGVCMMIRRDAFKEAGMFNPGYFMYCEDVDLCYEVRKSGRRVCYVGEATVIHHGGGSSRSKPESHYASIMIRQSALVFLRARRGRTYAALYRMTAAMAGLTRCGLAVIPLSLPLGSATRVRWANAFTRWLKVFRWAIGRERWAAEEGPKRLRRNPDPLRVGKSMRQ